MIDLRENLKINGQEPVLAGKEGEESLEESAHYTLAFVRIRTSIRAACNYGTGLETQVKKSEEQGINDGYRLRLERNVPSERVQRANVPWQYWSGMLFEAIRWLKPRIGPRQ